MLSPEIAALTITAVSLWFLHTLLAPDHYPPFVVMAQMDVNTCTGCGICVDKRCFIAAI